MELWFTYATRLSEIIFKEKLALYEDAVSHYLQECEEELNKSDKDASVKESESECSENCEYSNNLDKMNVASKLCLSSHARAQKTSDFIDEVEYEKECVYYTLENGYVVCEEDVHAAKESIDNLLNMKTNLNNMELTDTSESDEGSATVDLTLLYGELTSRGTRQLIDVFHHKCITIIKAENELEVEQEMKQEQENCKGQVIDHTCVIDVGTGTGKLLFEWSRLALQTASKTKNIDINCKSQIHQNEEWNNQEWSGLGIELAPSRYRIAIEALKPFVDELRITIKTKQESNFNERNISCKLDTDAVQVALQPVQETNSDKCKKNVVASSDDEETSVEHKTFAEVDQGKITKCNAARCALYNGDVFTPHLLTFDTMQQLVHYYIDMNNNNKGNRINNTESQNSSTDICYYKILKYDEIDTYRVHLCVFCCGLGFDECFIRKLCSKLE